MMDAYLLAFRRATNAEERIALEDQIMARVENAKTKRKRSREPVSPEEAKELMNLVLSSALVAANMDSSQIPSMRKDRIYTLRGREFMKLQKWAQAKHDFEQVTTKSTIREDYDCAVLALQKLSV